uniref:Guanosine-3',5'-bis(diphosphate) 3'-pyrophosphohydrolase MESH1 n=1 Tax=Salmo trutta TaxID=8032 RepID=A0A674ES19_SALTR
MSSESVILLETVNFAAEKHRYQRRKDAEQTPYINHPIGVARILSHEGGITDIEVLQAALLHDTVEDTDTSIGELQAIFGQTVARIVQEVTDDKALSKQERKRQQVEHAPHASQQAKLVKLADKLYNLRDLNRCTPTAWHFFCTAVLEEICGCAPVERTLSTTQRTSSQLDTTVVSIGANIGQHPCGMLLTPCRV